MDDQAMERLGVGMLTRWVTAKKPQPMMGPDWEFWCEVAGVDAIEFASVVQYQQRARS